ncbi:hypothetical protein D3C78_984010 [compost metagenome]
MIKRLTLEESAFYFWLTGYRRRSVGFGNYAYVAGHAWASSRPNGCTAFLLYRCFVYYPAVYEADPYGAPNVRGEAAHVAEAGCQGIARRINHRISCIHCRIVHWSRPHSGSRIMAVGNRSSAYAHTYSIFMLCIQCRSNSGTPVEFRLDRII